MSEIRVGSVKDKVTLLRLIEVTQEVSNTIQTILSENQEVVLSILSREVVWPKTCVMFARLYHRQQNRADFGLWLSYYENLHMRGNDEELANIVGQLFNLTKDLRDSFYGYETSISTITSERDKYKSKGWMLYELGLQRDTADLEFETKFVLYLEHIRDSLESIGNCLGKLLVIRDNFE